MVRTPQTPEDKVRSGIIMLIFAAIMLTVGIVLHIQSRNIIRQCSASVSGVIADVESKKVSTRSKYRSRSHTEYQAHIIIEDHSSLGTQRMVSGWTRTHYQTGDFILVYYDPDDPSQYYVEGAEPENGLVLLIFTVMFGACGIIFVKKGIDERRQIWTAVQ